MGSVYSNARLVISVTASKDGSGGLFLPKIPYCTISGIDEAQDPFEVYVRHQTPHTAFIWGTGVERTQGGRHNVVESPEYPLFTRAWFFQERVLGRRILHFTKLEVVFECVTSLHCEYGSLSEFAGDWLLPFRQQTASSSQSATRLQLNSSLTIEEASSSGGDLVQGILPDFIAKNLIRRLLRCSSSGVALSRSIRRSQSRNPLTGYPPLLVLRGDGMGP